MFKLISEVKSNPYLDGPRSLVARVNTTHVYVSAHSQIYSQYNCLLCSTKHKSLFRYYTLHNCIYTSKKAIEIPQTILTVNIKTD